MKWKSGINWGIKNIKHPLPYIEKILIRYRCNTCGNKCLQETKPDNSVCGGCNNPDWVLSENQESYKS